MRTLHRPAASAPNVSVVPDDPRTGLAASPELLEALFARAPEIITIVDNDGRQFR